MPDESEQLESEAAEEAAWKAFALDQFAAGYADSDDVYDAL